MSDDPMRRWLLGLLFAEWLRQLRQGQTSDLETNIEAAIELLKDPEDGNGG